MPTRPHVIVAILLALLSVAWFSPCCCQGEWMAEQTARLLASGQDEKACCCCKVHPKKTRDCCPMGAKGCKQSVGKMLTLKPGPEAPQAPVAWVWIDLAPITPTITAAQQPVAYAANAPPRPDGTLLGLRCALTI